MNDLQKFFWFCSGVNANLLKRCPTDLNKYVGIGATVFFTGLFAACSGSFALYYVFNDSEPGTRLILSLLFGLTWGAMIFNLDRYIVSSMKKTGNFLEEFKYAFPRFFLAAIIAIVISKPLELQIFHTSVEYELEAMKQKEIRVQDSLITTRYTNQVTALEAELQTLQAEVDYKTLQRDRLDEEARKEADGTGGSGSRGAARIYNLKKVDADKSQIELNQTLATHLPQIQEKQRQLNELKVIVEETKRSVKRGAYDGFDKRLDALGRAAEQSNTIGTASIFVMLLFLALELSPVLVKLISRRGPYDDMLEKHEHEIETFKVEKISKLNQKTNERLKLTVEASNEAVRAELEGNKDLMQRIVKAETEIAQAQIDLWKEEQIRKLKKGDSQEIKPDDLENKDNSEGQSDERKVA